MSVMQVEGAGIDNADKLIDKIHETVHQNRIKGIAAESAQFAVKFYREIFPLSWIGLRLFPGQLSTDIGDAYRIIS